MPELRFYCFVNYYLSSMQQGIQTGHCAVDLVRKYTKESWVLSYGATRSDRDTVESWADNHKTFITLNGGNNDGIKEATRIISSTDFPWVSFNEDEQSLGGLQTCVGVVLPENIFKAKPGRTLSGITCFKYTGDTAIDAEIVYMPDHKYFELVNLVTSSGLAK